MDDPLAAQSDNGRMPNPSSKPKRPRDVNQLAKAIVERATAAPMAAPEPPPTTNEAKPPEREKDPAAVSLGRRGGLRGGPARAKKFTAEERSEIGKKAAEARWGKR